MLSQDNSVSNQIITSLVLGARKMKPETLEAGEASNESPPKTDVNKGVSKLDFIMRIVAMFGTLGSVIAMSTINQTLPFSMQFFRFGIKHNGLPTFTFFVVANVMAFCYLVLSLALSIFHIVKSAAGITRVILIFLDTTMLALLTSGASAAAGIVHLAHNGNAQATPVTICQQHGSFCERVSGSLVGSYIGCLVFLLLIVLSALALSRN